MKKIYVAAALFLGLVSSSQAQILLSEDFQGTLTNILVAVPPGNATDPDWYSYDEDGNTPDPTVSTRPMEWYASYGYADVDFYTPASDTNIVLSSNSWFSPTGTVSDWLVSPSIDVPAGATGAVLKFKSASYQTPYYLDGYEVMISNTDNSSTSFVTQLYRAAEYVSGNALTLGDDFASYTFAPVGAWIQGWDGTNKVMSEIQFNPNGDGDTNTASNGDSARYIGILTPKVISLGAYAGQTIFIAFHHNSFDDNVMAIDDVVIDATTGIGEVNTVSNVSVYPNPTVEFVTIEMNVAKASAASVMTVTDIFGRLVYTQSLGMQNAGANKFTIDAGGYAAGTYNVQVKSDNGVARVSFIKK
jgi:hypothetical protein